LYVLSHK